MNPLVSVIIPAYNVENYIEKAIQSVLEQTYPNFEVIIIDDNSTDRTVDVVCAFHDERIKLLVNEQNMGPSYSRNRGIMEAKGEWIALLDSDDWWDKDRLAKFIKVVKHFSPDIVADDINVVWETKRGNYKVFTTILKQRGLENLNRFISVTEFIDYDFGIMKPMFKKEIFGSILYRTDLRFVEDFDLYLRILLKNYKWYQLNDALYYYRQRKDSLIKQQVPLKEQSIKQIDDLLQEYELPHEVKKSLIRRKERNKEDLRFAKIVFHIKTKSFGKVLIEFFNDPLIVWTLLKRMPKVIKERYALYMLMRTWL